VLLGILLAGAVALIAYALTRERDPEAGPDALTYAVVAARSVSISELTDDPGRAREFIRDEFGWRVGVPVFQRATLRGVGITQITPGVEVPIFRYADERGREVTVFALSYALLDQVPDRLRLSRADYERLAADTTPSVRRVRGSDVLLWRDRDDIYVAVTAVPTADLVDRVVMAR
jgi:hypothetical protein